MATFSQRMGYKPISTTFQTKDMDLKLRTSLWNVIYDKFLKAKSFQRIVWKDFFRHPLTMIDNPHPQDKNFDVLRSIEIQYCNELKWNEVYDFIEFSIQNSSFEKEYTDELIHECNKVLEREMSGYRIVGDYVAPITSKEELISIDNVLKSTEKIKSVNEHIQASIQHLSNRENPDYRNSIKEAISAVESLCIIISSNDNATLGDALKEIEKSKKITLHPALKEAFSKLYGYTNDAQGIRHGLGLTEEPYLDQEDALFMLVSCSAFINHLTIKCSKAGIDLTK